MTNAEKTGRRETLIITTIGLWTGYFLVALLIRYVAGGSWGNSLTWIFYMDWKNYVPVIMTLLTALFSASFLGKRAGLKILENPKRYWLTGVFTAISITFLALLISWIVVALMEFKTNLSSFNDMAEESYAYLIFTFVGLFVFFIPAALLGIVLGKRIKDRVC